jgi:uncharacterized iron-regulated protein
VSALEEGDIVHIPTGVKIGKEEFIEMLRGVRIIYVGEAHDNINSHKVQLEILKALAEPDPQNIAVGMEMLKRSSQESADQWTGGELDDKEFVRVWVNDWANDFQYYRSILEYVQAHKIPLLALRAPDEWLETVKETEPAAQLQERQAELPEMDLEDPYHRAHTEAIFKKHPRSKRSFEDFYKVQVLWDESMAASIAEYLLSDAGQDKQMLIFAGGQHVEYGFGIPRRVFRRRPLAYSIVLPTTIHVDPEKAHKLMNVTMPEVPLLPGDFAWIVGHEDLEDQKAYLGVTIRDVEGGVKILRAMKNSAAEEAGLQQDDIITAFDGEPIATAFDLTYLISLKTPGDKAAVDILRDEQPLNFEVTLQASPFHR